MPTVRPRRLRLNAERLEDRSTPDASGIAWPDGSHLTLSFVPDGTNVGGNPSSLFRTMDAIAPRAVWEREVLRAFQTWASQTNLNVGVVADGGQPLGTTGAVQGDGRFGDIRIAAIPLKPGTLATNTPFEWSGTTWSGDVVINTNYAFSVGGAAGTYDLYTALLNEAGNVFGVTDSRTDTASGVYYQYVGPKAGLDANDVADIHAQYGAREADPYDAARSNDTLATATPLSTNPALQRVEADIGTPADRDYYSFQIPRYLNLGVSTETVRLKTVGLSTLAANLDVYDSSGRLVGRATPSGQLGDDLAVKIYSPKSGGTYYARVSAADGSVFGVGGYQLNTSFQYLGVVTGLLGPLLPIVDDGHGNDILSNATALLSPPKPAPDARFQYTERATLSDVWDVDYYKVLAPAATDTQKLNVIVWGTDQTPVAPRVDVFDASGNPLPAVVLANANGTFSVELANTTPGAAYYLKVSALYPGGSRSVGNYFLGADFSTQPPVADSAGTYAAGSLTAAANQDVQSVTIGQNRLFEFALSAQSPAAMTEVRMDVVDASGRVVFTLQSYAGQPRSTGTVYLQAGTYTVRFTAASWNGSLAPTTYSLTGWLDSDPIGPRYTGGTSPGTTTTGGTSDSWGPTSSSSTSTAWNQPYYM